MTYTMNIKESLQFVKNNKGVLTGSPIRKEILSGSKEKGKEICGFKNDKDIILIMGGSLGSKVINDNIRKNIDNILKDNNIIHICGKGNVDESLKKLDGYKQFEYVSDELKHLMQSADYIISRAGANSIFEFLALKKPTLLIPLSKNASRGDQILNANSFKKEGFSLVMQEEELQEKGILEGIKMLKESKHDLVKNMNEIKLNDGVKEIISVIKSSITR